MKKMKNKVLTGAVALALSAPLAFALDEDEGDRENYVLNAAGQVLVVKMPTDDEASIYRRSAAGADSPLMLDGSSQDGQTVDGIGSNPHMNGNGVAIWQVAWASDDVDGAVFTGTPGSVTEIARTGDTISGEQLCSPEPFPLINSGNVGFYGFTLEAGPGQDTCYEDGDRYTGGGGGVYTLLGRKGIFRFTPPGTNTLLLTADHGGSNSPDSFTTANSDWVGSSTTFVVTDAHLIAHGGDAVTSSGNAVVTAWFAVQGTTTSQNTYPPYPWRPHGGNRQQSGFLYLTGGTPQLVAMTSSPQAADGNSVEVATRRFSKLEKPITNSGGQVLFRGANNERDYGFGGVNSNPSPGSYITTLNFWTSGGGISEMVRSGNSVPGGGLFEGFAPHYDLNDGGGAAFTAGLVAGDCAGDVPYPGDECRGVYYKPSGSPIVEVARNQNAGAGNGANSAEGFDFESLGSVAVMSSSNTVYFVAMNEDSVGGCDPGDEDFSGGDSEWRSGIFGWNSGVLQKLVAEGDIINGNNRVLRLFLPMPELRQHDAGNNFVVRAWLDAGDNDSCVADTEQTLRLSFATAAIAPMLPIPALGPWALWLLGGLVGLFGGWRLLRK